MIPHRMQSFELHFFVWNDSQNPCSCRIGQSNFIILLSNHIVDQSLAVFNKEGIEIKLMHFVIMIQDSDNLFSKVLHMLICPQK